MIRSSRISALGLVVSFLALVALARRAAPAPAPTDAPAHVATAVAPAGPIDVNAATVEQLVTLPRIGPALAARIVADREANGPFATLDALDRVPGIGPRTIDVLRPHAVAR